MATSVQNPPAEQTQALQKVEKSPLFQSFAAKYELTPHAMVQTLIQTVFPHGPNDNPPTWAQLAMFMSVAQQYNLNPFIRQIYAFPDKKSGGIVPIVPVDGWVTLIQRQKEHDGEKFHYHWSDGSTTEGAVPPVTTDKEGKKLKAKIAAITAVIYRKDHTHPTEVTELFDECFRPTNPWDTMPTRMLRHKAYMQCGRIAYGLAGLYDEDEAQDIIQGGTLEYVDNAGKPGVSDARAAQGFASKSDEIKAKIEAAKNGNAKAPEPGAAETASPQTEKPAGEQIGNEPAGATPAEASDNRTTAASKEFQYDGKIIRISKEREVKGQKKGAKKKYYVVFTLQDYDPEVFCFDSTVIKLAQEHINEPVGLILYPSGPRQLINCKGFFFIGKTEYDINVPVIRREKEVEAEQPAPAESVPETESVEVTEEDLTQYGVPGLFSDKKDADEKW